MAGYRESSYDPKDYERFGPPLRPYNWVQWLGVAVGAAGIAIEVAFLAGRAGWMRQMFDGPMIGSSLVLIAVVLVNSRREVIHDPAPELAPARRRWMIIIVTVCVVLIGTATIVQLLEGF